MRTPKYANIVLTISASALIFPCSNTHQEKFAVRVAAQQEVTVTKTGGLSL